MNLPDPEEDKGSKPAADPTKDEKNVEELIDEVRPPGLAKKIREAVKEALDEQQGYRHIENGASSFHYQSLLSSVSTKVG